ncbi:large ribosomal subunit protein bL17m isoform X2 [Hetaerina americana]|uniref:large ribosomal subunit protein bL17m isoform X2 n=1 Tax=Hetaerina americana TaxID=62018 RepID=UPI003A7F2197
MNQADITKLVSRLRIPLNPSARKLKNVDGPLGRINKLRKTVTGLFKYERIELNYHRADEARGYAERLISEAIRNGDRHKETMEMADFWLLEKQLVHKLFKVFVPRFENSNQSYTRMLNAPRPYPGHRYFKSVLELRDVSSNKNLIHNVLLEEARKEYTAAKYSANTAESSAKKESS